MKKLLAVLFVLLLMPAFAHAATTVNLAWDANTEPDLAGYKLYHSTSPAGIKSLVQTLGLVTTFAVTGLADGQHCWVLTAFDTVGNESGFSNQACFQADSLPPAAPKALRSTSAVVTP